MPTPVTADTIAPGSAAENHITVWDQTTVNPIPPGDVTWQLDPSLSAVVITPDAPGQPLPAGAQFPGFNFSAPANTPDVDPAPATATYTLAPGVTGVLQLSIKITVTGLTFTSP